MAIEMSDYISRELALVDFEQRNRKNSTWTPQRVKTLLMRIPSADAVPVRRGKWNIRVSDERTLCLECSVCGRRVDNFNLHRLLIFGEYGEACRRYPYCHCGAKMDLEDENNDD